MRLKSLLLLVVFIWSVPSFTGCASHSSATMHFSQPLNTNLSDYKSVAVSVTSNVANTDSLVMQIEDAIVSALSQQGKYSKVYSSSTGNAADSTELKIAVTITKIRDVNTFERKMLGALAGQGGVYADVELTESQSGKVLAKGSIEGKTSGGSIRAGTTPQAAERVAEEVVKFISSPM